MIIQDFQSDAFANFLSRNKTFWTNQRETLTPAAESKGCVLVELCHNNASLLMLNILVAQYLARLLGMREVIGGIAPSFTGFLVPIVNVTALAASYGIDRIFPLTGSPPAGIRTGLGAWWRATQERRRQRRVTASLAKLSGEALRRAILGLTVDGIWIGDLVYDSFLYEHHQATIETYGPALDAIVRAALDRSASSAGLLDRVDIRAVFLSHTVYADYGILARQALKRGIPVYGRNGLDPLGIRKYRTLAEAPIFPLHMSLKDIEYCREHMGERFSKNADEFYPPRKGLTNYTHLFRYGYGDNQQHEDGKALIARLGLDPSRKACGIMAHMFVDACHCYSDSLFDDYCQWLDACLEFTARTPEINWLVRQHPYEQMIGRGGHFQEIVSRHMKPENTIRVVDTSYATSTLFDCVDAVTTVNGTAGIEFASVGIPCILAGNPYYGDLGFAIRPRTKEDYFAALKAIPSLGRLSAEHRQLAKEAALMNLDYMRVSSNMVPFMLDISGREVAQDDIDQYWCDSSVKFDNTVIGDDPLYRSLRTMLKRDDTVMLSYETIDGISAE